jgi:hypothetical protein
MPIEISDLARQYIIGSYTKWVKRFDVNDYVKNPPMIEKLYEEKQLALAEAAKLENLVESLKSQNHELELHKQRLELLVNEAHRRSNLVFGLSLLATLFIGIGVNLVTSTPYLWIGWMMIISGCILEVVAFFSKSK